MALCIGYTPWESGRMGIEKGTLAGSAPLPVETREKMAFIATCYAVNTHECSGQSLMCHVPVVPA